jgi:hypothetical protein
MLTCKESARLLSQAQERPLGTWERLHLRLHLAFCDGCTNFRNQLAILRVAIRRLRDRE